jgi:hypothetical protein
VEQRSNPSRPAELDRESGINGDNCLDLTALYRTAIDHYFTFEGEAYTVSNSIPVLYFGDLKRYTLSRLKIVTVGLNPSDVEFKEDRFGIKDLKSCTLAQFEQSLGDYFKSQPYSQWFDQGFEKLLQCLDASYYGEHHPGKVPAWWGAQPNVVLHTDIGTPLATSPTWSKLPRRVTERLQETGFPLWRDLVQRLAPDLILISVAQRHLKLFGALRWRRLRLGTASRNEPELCISELGTSRIVWGRAQVRPFFFVGSEHRPLVATVILKEMQLSDE